MTQTPDMVTEEADLMNLLLSNTHETPGCHSNPPWTITAHEHLHPGDDFLESLLGSCSGGGGGGGGSEGVSSAPASPLWSTSASDSGVSDSHPWDLLDSSPPHPPPAASPLFTSASYRAGPLPPPHHHHHHHHRGAAAAAPPAAVDLAPPSMCAGAWGDESPDVSIDLGCMEPDNLREKFGIAYYLTAPPTLMQPTNRTPTVKDLLLTNLGQKPQPNSQQSLQGLVLDEDEKKLLAKEGVSLSNKLPLSKLEERVLKKIRRKIRNKRSAQESRQKKREYIDSLEGRMSACSEYNLDLQRKIHQLEHSNNALLEELSRIQDLAGTGPRRGPPTATCLLVLLLSFSLLLSASLQPYSSSQRSVYTHTKVPSRALLSAADPAGGRLSWGAGAPPASLMEKLWGGRPGISSSHDQEHNHKATP